MSFIVVCVCVRLVIVRLCCWDWALLKVTGLHSLLTPAFVSLISLRGDSLQTGLVTVLFKLPFYPSGYLTRECFL